MSKPAPTSSGGGTSSGGTSSGGSGSSGGGGTSEADSGSAQGKTGTYSISDITIRAGSMSSLSLPRSITKDKKVTSIEVKAEEISDFATYAKGSFSLKPTASNLGSYKVLVLITTTTQPDPIEEEFVVYVKPPLSQAAKSCPYGSPNSKCLPKIKSITNEGILTLLFPIKLNETLNSTFYFDAAKTLEL